jgi:hypothetical protein
MPLKMDGSFMNEYNFALHFKLADHKADPSIYEDRLFEAGCDDALLGIGQKGYIGLDFIRISSSAIEAVYSAIENVKSVIPDSELYYISPDVVGIPEIATIMNCTRQNILKLKNSHIDTFPFPINTDGKSLNWHLAEVLIPICVLKRNSQMREVGHGFKLLGNRVEKVETFT